MNQLSNHIKLKLLDYSIGKKNTITTSENIEKTLYSDIDSNLPIDYSRNMKNDTERNLKCDTDRNIINNEQNKEDKYIGKIVSNTIRSKFKVYFGEKGKYTLNMKIKYAINFLGLFGMRKMIVKIIDKKKEIIFNNKIPEWDIKYQKYLLDFNQRVRLTSKRNFILEDKNNKKVLQCGKIDNNIYALDYESPLNPFQAFSISITSIVNKIFCE